MRLLRVAALLVLVAGAITFAQRPVFDVASVKPNTSNGPTDGARPRRSGDLVMFHNTQPYSLIFYAYHLTANYQVAGYQPLPEPWSWVDIDARTGVNATDDQVRLMLQSLLEDRFKLKVHRETRNVTGYELAIANGKATLTPFRAGAMKAIVIEGRTLAPPREGSCGTSLWNDGAHLVCHAAGMDAITDQVRNALRSPVVDKTGLAGTYDVHIHYAREDRGPEPTMEAGPLLARVLQEELGLALKKGTAPVEVTVIDHMEKPSAN